MAIYFTSDMHLDEKKPELFQAFFSFLDKHQDSMDALYLLGDLFEYWIGDDDIQPQTKQFINRIADLVNRGIPCYIQYGNRDFMMGSTFFHRCKATLLNDQHSITVGSDTIVMCHGDTLCTKDIEYQNNRKWLRNPLLKFVVRNLPLKTRRNMAEKMRQRSKKFFHKQDQSIFDATEDAIGKILHEFKANILIHGHTHKPEKQALEAGQFRYVLGCWDNKGGIVAKYDESSGMQLVHSTDSV